MNISTRLAISFIAIIGFLIILAVYANISLTQVDRMHRYNLDFALTRRHTVYEMYGEFLGFRYILWNSYLSHDWRLNANVQERVYFNELVSHSLHMQKMDAQAYIRLLYEDPHISPQVEETVRDLMVGVKSSLEQIDRLRNAYFVDVHVEEVAYIEMQHHISTVIRGLREIISMANVTVEEVLDLTDELMANTRNISLMLVVITVLLATFFAYFTIQSFKNKVKSIEEHVRQIRWGDFERARDKGNRNEIANLIFGMVDVFTELIAEINHVANETSHGNLDIRISTEQFEGGYKEAAEAINQLISNIKSAQETAAVVEENSLAKSRFLARISHEIRTPLTAVLGIAEIQLQNPGLPLNIEEAFAKIHNAAGMLMSLVNDILDLSRIEAGKMVIVNSAYDVEDLIIDVVQLHLVYLGSKKVDFKVVADEHLPTSLIGDNLRIRQVIYNLLSNAFKYTEAGFVELCLSRTDYPGKFDQMYFVIRISDSGYGMSAEQVQSLHKEYERYLEHRDRDTVGSGLGMPIVYSLLQLLDASIEIESSVGEGTTIIVKIPQGIGSKTTLGPEAANLTNLNNLASSIIKKTKLEPEPMPYGKVLVVDDVDTNLYVARGLLMFYDLQIDTCENGLEAIKKIKNGNEYDIIFMDHMMPEMNGLEATQALRSMGYTKPIVALTANALIGQAEMFLQSGFDSFLSKPIQTVHLNATLLKYVRDIQPPHVLEAARKASEKRGDIEGYLDKEIVTLRKEFVRSQKSVVKEIRQAISAGDLEAAQRLAHTAKSLAGLIREGRLSLAAERVEHGFKDKKVSIADIVALENELTKVVTRITETTRKDDEKVSRLAETQKSPEAITALFNEVQKLLADFDAACTNHVERLQEIPEARVLAHQIEEFEFEAALVTLKSLRDVLDL